MPARGWSIRLGDEAENDFVSILNQTDTMFGPRQVDRYRATLVEALAALENGPDIPGSASRDEIAPGLRSLHVARRGRRGRHFIMYRACEGQVIEIVRILHDAMDFARHLPETGDYGDAE